jgi:hypothetical protein
MTPSFFNRSYTLRRFGAPFEVENLQTADYSERTVSMCVQKQVPSGGSFTPAGQMREKRLNGWSDDELIAADDTKGTVGDWLLYNGAWYECTSCEHLGHSPLHHYQSEWTRLEGGGEKYDSATTAPILTPTD